MPGTHKERFTREVLECWRASANTTIGPATGLTLGDLYTRLWQNIRSSGGLRLSESGRQILRTLGYQSWEYPAIIEPHFSILLSLDRKIPCPYFLLESRANGSIIFYDEKVATMYILAGDLKNYLTLIR
jgi:hypothetical protein